MGRLIYTAITSLDGYIEDPNGMFDWAVPDPELHQFLNEFGRTTGTELYGRRMYETMAVWQAVGDGPDVPAAEADFARVWRDLDKVVFSSTLDDVWTPRTRLERAFDPDAVRALRDASDDNISVSGPGLAQHAFAAGLVDEVHLFAFPIIVGGGKPALPSGVRIELELVEHRSFGNRVVHLHHRAR